MNLNWFLSRTVRQADQMRKHVEKILSAQKDLLSPQAIESVQEAMDQLRKACTADPLDKKALPEKMSSLEQSANKWLKSYPNAGLRENIEVLLVAIAVAMAIRTFFIQPFKIPTGSMQPTLFGITEETLIDQPQIEIPNPVSRFFNFWIHGVGYTHVVAQSDGRLEAADDTPQRFLLFNLKQRFKVGDDWYTVWFPPENLLRRADLRNNYGQSNPRVFKKGEDIIRLKVVSGDHLFVDRMTYNFRRPTRGEIIVFETKGIPLLPPDQFYIKRLVALGSERVRIGNDRHLAINGTRLANDTPHFERVYSFDPSQPARQSHYSGHLNETTARQNNMPGLAPKFPDEDSEFHVEPDHYMVMGDNTMNSSDSRTWGDFPRENVIGKSFFVYWPIGSQNGRASRFGWGNR